MFLANLAYWWSVCACIYMCVLYVCTNDSLWCSLPNSLTDGLYIRMCRCMYVNACCVYMCFQAMIFLAYFADGWSVCVCMCIITYVCTCVYVCACVRQSMMFLASRGAHEQYTPHTDMHAHITNTHVPKHPGFSHSYFWICLATYMHIYRHTATYVHTHTYIHTRTDPAHRVFSSFPPPYICPISQEDHPRNWCSCREKSRARARMPLFCAYVCVCVCIYIYIYIYIYMYVCMYTWYVCTYMFLVFFW
jgi:hypothetical protein